MKYSRFSAFLLTLVAVVLVSTSCKDEDEDLGYYFPKNMVLNVDDFYAEYELNSFTSFHSDEMSDSVYYKYNKVVNVTRYKADTTCFIAFYSSTTPVTDEQLKKQIDIEADVMDYNFNVKPEVYDTTIGYVGLESTAVKFTYFYEKAGQDFKMEFYYLINPNNHRAYRIRVSGPVAAEQFWADAAGILSSFRWK